MRHAGTILVKWITLVAVSAFLGPQRTTAQAQSTIEANDAKLQALTAPDLGVRSRAFYALMGPFNDYDGAEGALTNLLKANPGQADEIKVALFAALERESAYAVSLEKNGRQLPEGLLNYAYDLRRAVGSLRDPRALKGLLELQATSIGVEPDSSPTFARPPSTQSSRSLLSRHAIGGELSCITAPGVPWHLASVSRGSWRCAPARTRLRRLALPFWQHSAIPIRMFGRLQ